MLHLLHTGYLQKWLVELKSKKKVFKLLMGVCILVFGTIATILQFNYGYRRNSNLDALIELYSNGGKIELTTELVVGIDNTGRCKI